MSCRCVGVWVWLWVKEKRPASSRATTRQGSQERAEGEAASLLLSTTCDLPIHATTSLSRACTCGELLARAGGRRQTREPGTGRKSKAARSKDLVNQIACCCCCNPGCTSSDRNRGQAKKDSWLCVVLSRAVACLLCVRVVCFVGFLCLQREQRGNRVAKTSGWTASMPAAA